MTDQVRALLLESIADLRMLTEGQPTVRSSVIDVVRHKLEALAARAPREKWKCSTCSEVVYTEGGPPSWNHSYEHEHDWQIQPNMDARILESMGLSGNMIVAPAPAEPTPQEPEPCPRCKGLGTVAVSSFRDPSVDIEKTCHICRGRGTLQASSGASRRRHARADRLANR